MMNTLVALGYGIVTFAILLGTGLVVLEKFGQATGGAANTGVQYMITQLGSSGLAGWTGAIIALAVGLMFLGGFLLGKGGKRR